MTIDHTKGSRLHGTLAGRGLRLFDTLVDLVDELDEENDGDDGAPAAGSYAVARTVAEDIEAGTRLRVGDDGRVYADDPDPGDQ